MKPVLTLVEMTPIAQTADAAAAPEQPREERVRFCSRCASTTPEEDVSRLPYGFDRVCSRCGMGVMLGAPSKALPEPGAALVVVTLDGRISAVSEAAERLLGDEGALVDSPLTSLLTSPSGDELFVRAVARAARGERGLRETAIVASAPTARRVGPLRARIASCGPPRAALLVLERTPA